jgi:CHASE2 domain-containing sensor protein
MSEALRAALREYRRVRASEPPAELTERRRRILLQLLGNPSVAAELPTREALESAIAVFEDWEAAALAEPPAEAQAVHDALRRRLAALSGDGRQVPVLLVDAAGGGAVLDRLSVQILDAPGHGRVWTAVAVAPEVEAAATHAVVAACVALREIGYRAEPGDLEVVWQIGRADARVEGPSLGLALALAVMSRALARPLREGCAVTGEVSLDGRVLPVAGLAQKAAAAKAAEMRMLVRPAGPLPPGAAMPAGLGDCEIATLAHAARDVLGLRPARIPPRTALLSFVAASSVLALLALGALDLPALLIWPLIHPSLPESGLGDRVVLVTWDRGNGSGAVPRPGDSDVEPIDFTTFAEHRSYRATHPLVLRRLAEAGAAVVVVDAWIRGGDGEASEAIARAIRDAVASGTRVIVPVREEAGRSDPPDAAIAVAATALGFAGARAEGPRRLVRGLRLGLLPGSPDAGGPRWSVAALAVAALEHAEPAWDAPHGPRATDWLRLGTRSVGTLRGDVLLHFPERPGFRRYSYADVYYGRFSPDRVRGRVVLLGAAQGEQDRHRTPVGPWYGVEIVAAAVDGILRGDTARDASPGERVRATILALLPLVGMVLWWRGVPRRGHGSLGWARAWPLLAAAFAFAPIWLQFAWEGGKGVFVPWTDPLLTGTAFVIPWVLEARRRRRGRLPGVVSVERPI